MILVSVGTQGPFDRLIQAVDRWASRSGRSDVFAQIGQRAWKPAHVRWTEFMEPPAFRSAFEEADVIVSHAGIGTLVAALELGKSIVVMPRLAHLREHRNDHQLATAEHFCSKHDVRVATDDDELAQALEDAIDAQGKVIIPAPRAPLAPSRTLLESVRTFIEG